MLGEQIPLQQWSSFFSITAAASATLLGLLFVVITIAPGIGRQLASKSKVYLTPAVIYLTSVLIMSALLTIPNQTRLSAVICISIMCVFGLLYIGSLMVMRNEFTRVDLIGTAMQWCRCSHTSSCSVVAWYCAEAGRSALTSWQRGWSCC
jgi:hypothetical protein